MPNELGCFEVLCNNMTVDSTLILITRMTCQVFDHCAEVQRQNSLLHALVVRGQDGQQAPVGRADPGIGGAGLTGREAMG